MVRVLPIACLFVTAAEAGKACSKSIPGDVTPGQEILRSFQQTDSDTRLGSYARHYLVQLPTGYTGKETLPVMFYFHGWCESWKSDSDNKFIQVANEKGYIMVRPKGMADGDKGCPSWNVNHGGRTDVCVPKDAKSSVVQYTSCQTIGKTGSCNCYTCYDDVKFVSDLTAQLADDFCIDEDNVFGTGGSNGAMFLYPLVAGLAERGLKPTFRAILPNYGAFLKNLEDVPASLKGTSVFAFHGSEDTEVPFAGGEASDGWLYTPVHQTLASYASMNGCASTATSITTAFDGRKNLNGCSEFKGCNGGRVVHCNFKEAHGFWEPYQEEMMWSFFSSVMTLSKNVSTMV